MPRRAAKTQPKRSQNAAAFEPIVSPLEDPHGRADILIQRALKRGVENCKDPAILALYGRFGNTLNTLISDFCGPYEKSRRARA